MVSPTMTKDVGDQLGIGAFSSCSRYPPAELFGPVAGFVARTTQPECDGRVGVAERRHIRFRGLTLGRGRANQFITHGLYSAFADQFWNAWNMGCQHAAHFERRGPTGTNVSLLV